MNIQKKTKHPANFDPTLESYTSSSQPIFSPPKLKYNVNDEVVAPIKIIMIQVSVSSRVQLKATGSQILLVLV